MIRLKQFLYCLILVLIYLSTTSYKIENANEVQVTHTDSTISIDNSLLRITFDLKKGNYSAVNKSTNAICIIDASFSVNQYTSAIDCKHNWLYTVVEDELGIGKKLVIESTTKDSLIIILEITVYQNQGFFSLNCGVHNLSNTDTRIMKFSPLTAKAFPGYTFDNYKVLDGESSSYQTSVTSADTLACSNNLLVTFGEKGKQKNSLVIGGLTYNEFRKSASVIKSDGFLNVSVMADDPVGKLVDKDSEYFTNDKFYVDFTTNNRFEALENYGKALRIANHCQPSGVNYPILNLWYAQWERGGNDTNMNNTPGSIWALDNAIKSGITKYCKVGIRLEPDDYSAPNNQQGWWDNEHFQKYQSGGFQKPYETAGKWGSEITRRGGVPYFYVQTARRSEDYCIAYPNHMLFNDPFKLRTQGGYGWWNDGKGDIWWSYDFTDPEFINHMKDVYHNLKKGGVKGLKFDYPETGWAYDGGFEDKYATTTSAYRNIYKLAYEGLGSNCDVQERLPMFGDVNLGVITTIRSLGDGDFMYPPFASKTGLRWYKNRVVVNYDMDAKNPFDAIPKNTLDGVRAMFTMTLFTTGRIEIGKYFNSMTKDQLFDISRVLPLYETPKSARPIDGFTCQEYPRIYDFDITNEWHILTFYNTSSTGAKWPVQWPEWYEPLKTIPIESTIQVILGDYTDDGGLGLAKNNYYYIWDFWNWQFVGKFSGTDTLKQHLRPAEARVFAIHQIKPYPQFISSNRHVMQGYVDLKKFSKWNSQKKYLSGISKVIGGEPYKMIIASNGFNKPICKSKNADCTCMSVDSASDLLEVTINTSETKEVEWKISFE